MNDADKDKTFTDRARSLFDESVDGLDAATLSKLNQGRQRALEKAKPARSPLLRWAPAGGLATAAAVALLLIQTPTNELPTPDTSNAADFEILLGEDSLDMLEDLEFYSWLDTVDAGNDDNLG